MKTVFLKIPNEMDAKDEVVYENLTLYNLIKTLKTVMSKAPKFKQCERCGMDLFFLETGKSKSGWEAFEADVTEIRAVGIRFADGKDNVQVSDAGDIGRKGFRKHFCRR